MRPHFVAGNPRKRTRTPARRRATGLSSSSSYGSAKSSLKSRRNLRFDAPLRPLDSETYLSSGASSTSDPPFDITSFFRKPEQGRENRLFENNPPHSIHRLTSSPRTLSGTHLAISHAHVPENRRHRRKSVLSLRRQSLQQNRPSLRHASRPQRQNHISCLSLVH